MKRRGNGYDNAVAESFFQLLKRKRIKRKIYKIREGAMRDIFDCIEMFYNPIHHHGNNGNLSAVQFERKYLQQAKSVYQTGVYSIVFPLPNHWYARTCVSANSHRRCWH